MNFHDVRFPTSLSIGSTGGPERRTEIVTLNNGYEERNSPWRQSRRRYDAGVAMRSIDDLEAVIAFFEARQGRLYGFLWKDWSDFKSCPASSAPSASDQDLGISDGAKTVFQLGKTYKSGEHSHWRDVRKPVTGSVLVAVDGVSLTAETDFTVDYVTGEVTFSAAPPDGAILTAGYEFDVPVRFDTDRLEINLASFSAGDIPNIPIIEVRS